MKAAQESQRNTKLEDGGQMRTHQSQRADVRSEPKACQGGGKDKALAKAEVEVRRKLEEQSEGGGQINGSVMV